MEDPYIVSFDCPHCKVKVLSSGEWFDARDEMLCPFCKQLINLDEVDTDDDGVIDFPVEYESPLRIHYYFAPILRCHNCSQTIELFYSNLPETDRDGELLLQGGDPPERPPAEWRAIFGCLKCGHVLEYAAAHVLIAIFPKFSRGSYQSGKGVCRVEFPCAAKDCKSPFSMYVDIGESTLGATVAKLRRTHFYYTLPCGHSLMPVPEKFYKVHAVTRRLW
jgi:hypothetical protein